MSSLTTTLAGYAILLAGVILAEGYGLYVQDERYPTLGGLMDFLVRTRAGRWLVLVGWWWLGWHLFVR